MVMPVDPPPPPASGPVAAPAANEADDLPAGLGGEVLPRPNPFHARSVGAWKGPLPAVPFVCRRLHIAPGRPTGIIGYAGSKKTMLVYDLAMAVAAPEGRPTTCWGGVPVERRGRVWIADLEVGEYLTRQRLTRFAVGRWGQLEDWADTLDVSTFPKLSLTDPGVEQDLIDALTGYTLAIIDSLSMMLGETDENSSAVAQVAGVLARVSERTGCALVIIHHEGKPPQDGTQKASNVRGRGSSAIQGLWSSQWSVTPGQGGTLTMEHGKSQWGPEQPSWACRIVDSGERDEALGFTEGLRFEPLTAASGDLDAVSEIVEPGALQQAKRLALDVLEALGPLNSGALVKQLRGNQTVRWRAIAELTKAGRIIQDPDGKATRIRLPSHAPPSRSQASGVRGSVRRGRAPAPTPDPREDDE